MLKPLITPIRAIAEEASLEEEHPLKKVIDRRHISYRKTRFLFLFTSSYAI